MNSSIIYNPHVSVDCVIFGFDGSQLKVLLIERSIVDDNKQYNDKKLPGSIILNNEDLDDAANRVLNELTGLKKYLPESVQKFWKSKTYRKPA